MFGLVLGFIVHGTVGSGTAATHTGSTAGKARGSGFCFLFGFYSLQNFRVQQATDAAQTQTMHAATQMGKAARQVTKCCDADGQSSKTNHNRREDRVQQERVVGGEERMGGRMPRETQRAVREAQR